MPGLINLREELNNKILKLRSVLRLIESQSFERVWNDSSKEEQEQVIKWMWDGQKNTIADWIANHRSYDIGELSMQRLRDICFRLRIPGYSRKTKQELVAEIKEKEKDL